MLQLTSHCQKKLAQDKPFTAALAPSLILIWKLFCELHHQQGCVLGSIFLAYPIIQSRNATPKSCNTKRSNTVGAGYWILCLPLNTYRLQNLALLAALLLLTLKVICLEKCTSKTCSYYIKSKPTKAMAHTRQNYK